MNNGTLTGLLLKMQTVRQQQDVIKRDFLEASTKAKGLQQTLQRLKMQEGQLSKVIKMARAQQMRKKAQEQAMEKAKRMREVAMQRKQAMETSKYRDLVASLLTDVRYDTGSRKTKRAIRKARKRVQKQRRR
jgi:tRNA/tmRNA/rRNA uracil-C5-methylase (TrmA/RlmC/RlmD family)